MSTLQNFPSLVSNVVNTKKAAASLDFRIFNQVRVVPLPNHKLKKTLTMAQPNSDSTYLDQNPEEQQQKIVIQNSHGEKLVGLLRETGTMEIVVLCHGFRSTKESSTIASLAVALGKEGISVFCFDFAGNGESEGTFEYGNYSREADDLHDVIKYLNGMKREVAAIVGHSKGGDVVLVYASKYRDIGTVINVSGRYNLERGIDDRLGKDFLQIIKKHGFIDVKTKTGDAYRVTEKSLMERLNTNMHEACLNIDKSCRVLTVHGSADEVIPLEDALDFDKIIPNHKLHIIEEANHSYTSHQAELASVVVPFIKDGLHHSKST